MPSLTVRAQPLNDVWQPYGTDRRRGIWVEDFQCSADAFGPLDATWTLRRSPRVTWPDLGFGTPVEVELGGTLPWSGRIKNTPGTDGDDRQIQVQAEGWQFAADDFPITKMYVRNSLPDWQDIRSNALCDLTRSTASTTISSDAGGITLTLPQGATRAPSTGGGVVLDLGPANTVSRVVISFTHSANNANTSLVIMGAADPSGFAAMSQFSGWVSIAVLGGTASGTFPLTVSSLRYLYIALADNTGSVTTIPTADIWAKLTAIQVFASTAYESGYASILTSSAVIRDVAANVGLWSSDQSLIQNSAFALPAFEASSQTPRDVIEQANSFQDWQFRINADRRPEFRPRPSAPILSLSDQAAFDDASSGSGDSVYNAVTYTGTGPDGTPVFVQRTTALAGLPATIPDRRGYSKCYTISSNASLTAAAASQLCDVFLAQHNHMPFKGTIHASSSRAVTLNAGGVNVPPSQLLRYPGELCSFKHLQDPDTGALSRDGRIAQVTYTHATDSADVEVDSTTDSFDALVARLAAVTAR